MRIRRMTYLRCIGNVLALTDLNIRVHGRPKICDAEDSISAFECLLQALLVR